MIVRLKFHRNAKNATFIHPMDFAPRTAILAPGSRGTRNARVFEEGWCEPAARFQPESTAATVSELRRLAPEALRLPHSAAALTYEGEESLNWADRELFWHAFGVLVYEQYFDVSNQLLAMECDAPASLHVIRGCEDHRLDRETCACGDRTPRLLRGPRIEELVELLA